MIFIINFMYSTAQILLRYGRQFTQAQQFNNQQEPALIPGIACKVPERPKEKAARPNVFEWHARKVKQARVKKTLPQAWVPIKVFAFYSHSIYRKHRISRENNFVIPIFVL